MLTQTQAPTTPVQRFTALFQDHRLGWFILILIAFAPLAGLGHGHDFFMHFRRYTLSGEYGVTTWIPYYGYWLIYPFAVIPHPWGLAVWNVLNALGLGLLFRHWGVNPLAAALTFPIWYLFGNGQIDGIIAAGIALSLGANPILAGLGLVIMSLKPHLTLLVAIYVLIAHWNWRLLVIPIAIFLGSLLKWGFWVPGWLLSFGGTDAHLSVWNVSFFPYSLILLPGLWFARKSPRLLLAATPLFVPYYAIYSLSIIFSIGMRWWLFLLIWAASLRYVTGGYTPWWGLVIAGLIWVAYRTSPEFEGRLFASPTATPAIPETQPVEH